MWSNIYVIPAWIPPRHCEQSQTARQSRKRLKKFCKSEFFNWIASSNYCVILLAMTISIFNEQCLKLKII
ncbi:hypothetical protein [Rickettsia asembonensis]|uniref:Uncharacterized protein n=1 Tax=Rickettsia asembonensis TaxID=1068590 RepID=A0A0C2QZ91_9RICK|nr:hypothetical protein [Rickettsia asembonensis]KIJ89139.1 hypothetical protein SB78_01040 [Rickettsia asembonensis]